MEELDNSYDIFKNLLKNLENSKNRVKKLLESILKNSILDIEFEGTEHFDSIIEYDFSLLKANIIYSNGKKDEIYLKMIKGGKIKESIFCYWSLLYEEFLKKNQSNIENVVQKAIITQITSDESTSNLLLTLNAKLNYCAEINLVELKSFLIKNNNYERWLESLEIKNDDILFIGKKMY